MKGYLNFNEIEPPSHHHLFIGHWTLSDNTIAENIIYKYPLKNNNIVANRNI